MMGKTVNLGWATMWPTYPAMVTATQVNAKWDHISFYQMDLNPVNAMVSLRQWGVSVLVSTSNEWTHWKISMDHQPSAGPVCAQRVLSVMRDMRDIRDRPLLRTFYQVSCSVEECILAVLVIIVMGYARVRHWGDDHRSEQMSKMYGEYRCSPWLRLQYVKKAWSCYVMETHELSRSQFCFMRLLLLCALKDILWWVRKL